MPDALSPRLLLRRLAGLGLLLLAALPAQAQSNSDGSIYSRFGLGTLQRFGSSEVEAMGGAGLALRSYNYVNFDNPASWSDQILTRAALGLAHQTVTLTDAQENESRLSAGSLNAIQFSFPIYPRKLGAVIAFHPYSRTNYRVEQEGMLPPNTTVADSVRYVVGHEGRGGLQQVGAGVGFRPHPAVSVGAHVGLIFGILEEARRTSFPDRTDFIETDFVTATRLAGVTGRLGVLASPVSVLRRGDMLSVAATFTLPTTLRGARVQTLGESLDRDTLGARVTGDAKLPFGAGLGLAYRLDDRWVFAADGLYEPWSDFSSDLGFPGYDPSGVSTFDDRLRAGAGIEFVPAGDDLIAPYFRRTAYRLGFYYDRAYAAPVAGADVHTMAVTGGLSLPTLLPGTRLDLNLAVGRRGSTDDGLIQDRFYRFTATVNIGERWFQVQRLR